MFPVSFSPVTAPSASCPQTAHQATLFGRRMTTNALCADKVTFGQEPADPEKMETEKASFIERMKAKRFDQRTKNAFRNVASYFNPKNWTMLYGVPFDIALGTAFGALAALGTPVMVATIPPAIALMVGFSMIWNFAVGFGADPDDVDRIRGRSRK